MYPVLGGVPAGEVAVGVVGERGAAYGGVLVEVVNAVGFAGARLA